MTKVELDILMATSSWAEFSIKCDILGLNHFYRTSQNLIQMAEWNEVKPIIIQEMIKKNGFRKDRI